ncbi:hypothetical protein OGATHE_003242 [Ogataea polymorpha]|uniref:Uncharacterized protein n=1 Tax=Ogataea polymorpha TaxID=460523 RepID=A0A9P8PA48_9ASCO|nr:hypothetical protein OGATHE_003242 [Ogataea polymorpha]
MASANASGSGVSLLSSNNSSLLVKPCRKMYRMAPNVPPIESLTTLSKDSRVCSNDPLAVNRSFSRRCSTASAPILRPSPQSPSPILVSQIVSSGSLAMTLRTAVRITDSSVSGLTLMSPLVGDFSSSRSSSRLGHVEQCQCKYLRVETGHKVAVVNPGDVQAVVALQLVHRFGQNGQQLEMRHPTQVVELQNDLVALFPLHAGLIVHAEPKLELVLSQLTPVGGCIVRGDVHVIEPGVDGSNVGVDRHTQLVHGVDVMELIGARTKHLGHDGDPAERSAANAVALGSWDGHVVCRAQNANFVLAVLVDKFLRSHAKVQVIPRVVGDEKDGARLRMDNFLCCLDVFVVWRREDLSLHGCSEHAVGDKTIPARFMARPSTRD